MSEHHAGDEIATDWEAAYAGAVPDSPVDSDLVAVARDLPPGRALDLGCGTGQNSIWLARQGWRVHGIDIAEGAVERARAAAERAGVKATFEKADVTSWRTRERYDLVVSTYAMPPSGPGRINALTCTRDAVAAGGTVLIAEFERSLADTGWMAAEQLVTLDEIVEMLPGFELAQAEVKIAAHSHGDDHAALPIVLVVAVDPRPRS